MNLYDYQEVLEARIYHEWQTFDNILVVLPCRAGKTVIFCKILRDSKVPAIALAHRAELVFQMSMTLAKYGVIHNIIGPKPLIKNIIHNHVLRFGRNFYNPSAKVHAASVQTLIKTDISKLNIGRWITDEAHHLIEGSVWAKCIEQMPGAKGAGFTATPARADGKGLGRKAHGLFDVLIEGPVARDLINRKFITDYRIIAPQTNIDLSKVPVGSGGDYVLNQLRESMHKSKIVGDTVANYKKFAMDCLTLVFTVDIESAEKIADAFNAEGIPAQAVSGKTDPAVRAKALRNLETGTIKVLCNCELFGEGTDLPAVDCVIFARPTESFPYYYQQFFRPLSLDPANPDKVGLIIDQVGNVIRHGLPDAIQNWSLNARERRTRTTTERSTITSCLICFGVYDKVIHGLKCPYCFAQKEPVNRSLPEHVDGDLSELSPDVLALLRGEIDSVYAGPKIPYGAGPEIKGALLKHYNARLEALEQLKHEIAIWAIGKHNIPAAQREFYHLFGIDVMSAQALHKKEALELIERIKNYESLAT